MRTLRVSTAFTFPICRPWQFRGMGLHARSPAGLQAFEVACAKAQIWIPRFGIIWHLETRLSVWHLFCIIFTTVSPPSPTEAVSYQTPWNPLEYGDVLWASEAQERQSHHSLMSKIGKTAEWDHFFCNFYCLCLAFCWSS